MTSLAATEIRVRRRPWAVAVFWAFRLFAGFVIALPISTAISGTGIGRFAAGDALLFQAGGLLLSETVRIGAHALREALEGAVFVLFLFAFAALVPLAALLIALASPERLRPSDWFGRALGYWPLFALFAGLTLFAQALVVLFFTLLHEPFRSTLQALLDERSSDLCSLAWFCLCLFCVLALGVIQDLVRAAAVRHGSALRNGLETALKVLAMRPTAVLVAWLIPALCASALVGLTAVLVGRAHIEHGGTGRLVLVLVVHQLAALGLVVLRATWLGRALELVGPTRSGEEAARD